VARLYLFIVIVGSLFLSVSSQTIASEFSDNTFLIAQLNAQNYNSNRLWNFLKSDTSSGIEIELDTLGKEIFLKGSNRNLTQVLEKTGMLVTENDSRFVPIFLNFNGDVLILDSIINNSVISPQIFYLPQGEAWPTLDYLVQADRRFVFFIDGNYQNESRILHDLKSYSLQISANRLTSNSTVLGNVSSINRELLVVNNFDRLPTSAPLNREIRNLVPDYINYLLDNWKKFGKKPNFLFVGNNILRFDFIIDQLNSFSAIKGQVRTSGKNLEKVYWKNPDVLLTGGKFSFPYRGGEELILEPFAPGYEMTPNQVVVTTEMVVPENYSILAIPLSIADGMTGSFKFEGIVTNEINPSESFDGVNYSFSRDIDRGSVLRLPENANINLGQPETYGLPNSSFTVSCFVKFTDILEFGDNAILGNAESGYRRGMHLVLRSGSPYFGLWANDFMSDVVLKNNIWYHLTWRYIIETGEQSIFLNGQFIGGSDGHPPYSGTSDLHVGSAISRGASLRGYMDNLYLWNRPLGNEEIIRLALDEEINLEQQKERINLLSTNMGIGILILSTLIIGFVIFFLIRLARAKKEFQPQDTLVVSNKNQIKLFGEFDAFNVEGEKITDLFTPKVKELFLFVLIYTLRNGIGAQNEDIDKNLWHGIESKKVANNRAVTLNKLRKILSQFNKVEIISNNGYLQLKITAPFFCDYIEAFNLCQIPQGLNKKQLETFFLLVKKGRLLKRTNWEWLDEIRGFTGNQVIDNLLKLAAIYKKENKLKELEAVAQRILDYDDLNEEAIYLQIWALQKANNSNLAAFNFKSFVTKYEENMGESFNMNFEEFNRYYSEKF